jgi:two-component system response regulator FixJ
MAPPRPALILIAADDHAVRDALQFALRLEGFGVRTHSTADALLGDAALGHATCVILDDRKPDLDGFDVIARLHQRDPTLAVILLASYVPARVRDRGMQAGFRAVLEKPLLNNILLDTLRMIAGPVCGEVAAGVRAEDRPAVTGGGVGSGQD